MRIHNRLLHKYLKYRYNLRITYQLFKFSYFRGKKTSINLYPFAILFAEFTHLAKIKRKIITVRLIKFYANFIVIIAMMMTFSSELTRRISFAQTEVGLTIDSKVPIRASNQHCTEIIHVSLLTHQPEFSL